MNLIAVAPLIVLVVWLYLTSDDTPMESEW